MNQVKQQERKDQILNTHYKAAILNIISDHSDKLKYDTEGRYWHIDIAGFSVGISNWDEYVNLTYNGELIMEIGDKFMHSMIINFLRKERPHLFTLHDKHEA